MGANDYYKTLKGKNVAQILLEYLKLEGVDQIFGIPGAAIMQLLVELDDQYRSDDPNRIRYVICRQETGAAFIADGYSRVTNKLGVVLVTSGPGATNAVTGTMNAHSSHSPILIITGEIPEAYFGKGYLQEGIDADLDINSIYQNAMRYSAVVSNAANFSTLFAQALRDALALPRRGAHVSLPNDLARTPIDQCNFPEHVYNYRIVPHVSNKEFVQRALNALCNAKRPLIFLGNGCRYALLEAKINEGKKNEEKGWLRQFTKFVERFGIPVMTTPNGKGVFPETHELSLRNYGIAACKWPTNYMLPALDDEHYDALLVVGSSLGELATYSAQPFDPILIPDGPLIQVDLDQSVIARNFPVKYGIVATIYDFFKDLVELSEKMKPKGVSDRKRLIKKLKQESPFKDPGKMNSKSSPIWPQALMECLNEMMPKDGHIFVDCANCVGWSLHYLTIDPPLQIHNSLSMGPMGFGVGAVIGGKIGKPNKTCVAIVGDGAFLMHGSEVSTAAQHEVGAIWIVLYNEDLAMVSQGMNAIFGKPENADSWTNYYQIGKPDLIKFAEGLGADAYTVESVSDMKRWFPKVLRNADSKKKPQVIVARIDTKEMPPYSYPQLSRQLGPYPR
ncbi:MAG TPA: thiamine pyrophosphate-binding protein [Candidatus Binatia bacterium]|jgi:acetolactate synthase-1/2/3 large subunit